MKQLHDGAKQRRLNTQMKGKPGSGGWNSQKWVIVEGRFNREHPPENFGTWIRLQKLGFCSWVERRVCATKTWGMCMW